MQTYSNAILVEEYDNCLEDSRTLQNAFVLFEKKLFLVFVLGHTQWFFGAIASFMLQECFFFFKNFYSIFIIIIYLGGQA